MANEDLRRQIEAMRRRRKNLRSRDMQRLAEQAGWVLHNTEGSHAIYIKEGFWANLSIPQGKLKPGLALRLLGIVESSLYEEGEE